MEDESSWLENGGDRLAMVEIALGHQAVDHVLAVVDVYVLVSIARHNQARAVVLNLVPSQAKSCVVTRDLINQDHVVDHVLETKITRGVVRD